MTAGGIASPSVGWCSRLVLCSHVTAPAVGLQARQRPPSPHHLLGTESATGQPTHPISSSPPSSPSSSPPSSLSPPFSLEEYDVERAYFFFAAFFAFYFAAIVSLTSLLCHQLPSRPLLQECELGIFLTGELHEFFDQHLCVLQRPLYLVPGDRSLGFLHKVLSLASHPVKAIDQGSGFFTEYLPYQQDDRSRLITTPWPPALSHHHCLGGPQHRLIGDGVRPLLVDADVRPCRGQILQSPGEQGRDLAEVRFDLLDQATLPKLLIGHRPFRSRSLFAPSEPQQGMGRPLPFGADIPLRRKRGS